MQKQQIAALYEQHLKARFPYGPGFCVVAGDTDLRMLDGEIALHVGRCLQGRYDRRSLPGLAQLCRQAARVLPGLDGEAREFFGRALALAQAVHEYQATEAAPGSV